MTEKTNNNGWKGYYLPTTTSRCRLGRGIYYAPAGKDLFGWPMNNGWPNQRPRKTVKVFSSEDLSTFEKDILNFPYWTLAKEFRDSILLMRDATFPSVHVYKRILEACYMTEQASGVGVHVVLDNTGTHSDLLRGFSTKETKKWKYLKIFKTNIQLMVNTKSDGLNLIRSNYWVWFDRMGGYNTGKHPEGAIMYFPGQGYIMKPTDPDKLPESVIRVTVFLKK